MRNAIRCAPLLAACIALFPPAIGTQNLPAKIDPGHSYATIWMGLNTEVSNAVNTGVAQVGGAGSLAAKATAAASLEVSLVPGGSGTSLLTPEGGLRKGEIAPIPRYTVMSFHSSSARVRRDGRLEFTGELSVTHVTRKKLLGDWNLGYSGSNTYSDPVTEIAARQVTFVVMTPHAEFIPSLLQEEKEITVVATMEAKEFPELPAVILDSDWPIVAEDEECQSPTDDLARRDYGGVLCEGKAIAVTNPPSGPPPSTGRDYTGMPRPVVPVKGPVTIVLHLKFIPTPFTTPPPE